MYVFIAGVDRSEPIRFDSLTISDELQQRVNQLDFELLTGPLPDDLAEVRAFVGFPVLFATSTTVTLDAPWSKQCQGLFRQGEWFYVLLNTANEHRRVIQSVDNVGGKIRITVTSAWANTPVAGDKAGKIRFGGNVVERQDKNIKLLRNAIYNVSCVDYSRIFDKENLNDSYVNRDARYIINDFCNTTINKNSELDDFEFTDNTATQAAWNESGDGQNPTLETVTFREGDKAMRLTWTNSGGNAIWERTISAVDVSEFTGVSSGIPTKGRIGFWVKRASSTGITTISIKVGSNSSNYVQVIVTPTATTDWVYYDARLATGSMVGTPNWLAATYLEIRVVETASSNILIDGLRLLEDKFFRHYPYVQETTALDKFNMNRLKPTEIMQRLADNFNWYWYIDYERYIHFFQQETQQAPFDINEASNNFKDLSFTYDISRLVNKQIVEGGEETSTQFYSEVREGNGVQREWLTKNKFKNLTVKVDKNTSNLTATTGTTTTSVTTTVAHGLSVGDFIVNRSRSNAVRRVLTTPTTTTYTVEAVTGQVSGDTLSKFVAQAVGVEGIDTDAGFNYLSNFNQKSIRLASQDPVLTAGQFVLFRYNEVVPILVQRTSSSSITAMRSILGYTNGVFEGQKITDRTIQSSYEAAQYADAILDKYSNVIITATFETDYDGLEAGMLIRIKDTLNGTRNIDKDFVIQSVVANRIDRWSTFRYKVTCSTLLFGILELFMQMLKQGRNIDVDTDAVVSNLVDADEILVFQDSWTFQVRATPFKYGPSSNTGIYNLSSYV